MIDLSAIQYHPEFPNKSWVIIEQPCDEPYRYEYDPTKNLFRKTDVKSLIYFRGFQGGYGWLGGTGTPPGTHFDVLVFTRQNLQPGDILVGRICCVFLRADLDHKFVALDEYTRPDLINPDLGSLDEGMLDELRRLYPRVGPNEGWFGRNVALEHLSTRKPNHD
jgi:inorganic pyrophosphatase